MVEPHKVQASNKNVKLGEGMSQQALQVRMQVVKKVGRVHRNKDQQAFWPRTQWCWWHCVEVEGEPTE